MDRDPALENVIESNRNTVASILRPYSTNRVHTPVNWKTKFEVPEIMVWSGEHIC